MTKTTTAAWALALGFAWATAPAIAQETTKDKAERKADQIEQKAADTKAKADDKTDTAGNRVERAWEKTKAKTREMTDTVKDKVGADDRPMSDVRTAQQALRSKGFNPGPIDGVMGPRTTAAVKNFQEKEDLTVTGALDAETHARLMASSAPAASPATEPKETNPKRQSQ